MMGQAEDEERDAEAVDAAIAEDEGWADLADAPIEADPSDQAHGANEEEVIVEGDLGEYQRPRGLPQPVAPTREARRLHDLTHLPYASWCWCCVSARKNNSPHFRSRSGADRDLPLFVMDYCFVRNEKDEQLAKVLVGKLYPSRKVFACIVDVKGTDEYAVRRLVDFIKESGLTKFVYKSDKEVSIIALMDEAIRRSGRAGKLLPADVPSPQAVPENSAVGESQSNGRAERTVQTVEDLLRTHKLSLETKIKARLPSDHAVLRWMVEFVADVLTKYTINSTGQSPYEELHGRKVREKRVEFGERVLYYVPKKGRAKLDGRWKIGVYLGHASNSNEVFIGIRNGNVVRSRSITRVVDEAKWTKEMVLGVIGTPSIPKHIEDGGMTDDEVERSIDPHDFDAEKVEPPDGNKLDTGHGPETFEERMLRENVADDSPARELLFKEFQDELERVRAERQPETRPRRVRITAADIAKHGYTVGCMRCYYMQMGDFSHSGGHNEECRARMYRAFEQEQGAKWAKVSAEVERSAAPPPPPAAVPPAGSPRPSPRSSPRIRPTGDPVPLARLRMSLLKLHQGRSLGQHQLPRKPEERALQMVPMNRQPSEPDLPSRQKKRLLICLGTLMMMILSQW